MTKLVNDSTKKITCHYDEVSNAAKITQGMNYNIYVWCM